jgi:putative transposase
MINQHLEMAMPSASFANAELKEFIDSRPDAREIRKTLTVKLVSLKQYN